jgi:hypothetical protein
VRQRLLTSLFVLASVTSVFAGSVMPAGADEPKYSGVEWIFFPWALWTRLVHGTAP